MLLTSFDLTDSMMDDPEMTDRFGVVGGYPVIFIRTIQLYHLFPRAKLKRREGQETFDICLR